MRKRLKARGTELKHERADQAPEGTGLRFEQPGGGGVGMDGPRDFSKFTHVFYRISTLWSRCPKSSIH